MPINDPIRDRKIAPNSLAFQQRNAGGGQASSTYQSVLQTLETNIVVYADSEIQNRDRHALATADRMAELRAKAWVSSWHEAFDWDIEDDLIIENNGWSPLNFGNETLRIMGAYQALASGGGPGVWAWIVPPHRAGTYWIYASTCIQFPLLAAVTEVKLGIFVNLQLRTVVDRLDANMSNDNADYVRDAILSGGRNISVNDGDIVQICVYAAGAEGDQSYGHPTSVVGYVSGHRVYCGRGNVINAQDDQNGYTMIQP